MSHWLRERLSHPADSAADEEAVRAVVALTGDSIGEEEEVDPEELVHPVVRATGGVLMMNATTTTSRGAHPVTGVRLRNLRDWTMAAAAATTDAAVDSTEVDLRVAEEASVR